MKYFVLDKIGIVASLVCAVHCAILPLAIGILPLIGMGFIANGLFDWIMVSIAGIVGYLSLVNGHKKHKKHTPMCFFVLGIFIILSSLFMLGHTHECGACSNHSEEIPWHSIMMTAGGILICASHFINIKLCKSCAVCNDSNCNKESK